MPKHKLDHVLTDNLLKTYTVAAMTNAVQLLQEAQLLLAHGHHARAYFLGVASIEECGKAYLTWDGRGRKLNDSRISRKLQKSLTEHPTKIRAAFTAPILGLQGDQEAILRQVDTMIAVEEGREPGMYTDIREDTSRINEPSHVVSVRNGQDCVRLAGHAIQATAAHLAEHTPPVYSKDANEWYLLEADTLQKMAGADFAQFMISRLEAGEKDMVKLFMTYYRDFFSKNVAFQVAPDGAS